MTGSQRTILPETVPQTIHPQRPDGQNHAGDASFRLLTDALPQIVYTMQPDGRCTWFNQRWLDYSGSSLQESLGHGWMHLVHPDDSVRVSGFWIQARPGTEPFEINFRLRRSDGIYRWMLARAVAQPDAAGQLVQWLGTLTDIDDLTQVRVGLEKNLSMNRVAGRVALLGGWVIELPEHILTWSDENCLIHDVPPGYTPTLDEGIGYFLPEHRHIVMRHVQDCARHGISYEFVLPKRTAKGRLIWVRSIGEAVRDAAGKIIRLQGAFQDITEQKKAEDRMHALQAQLIATLESITDGFCLIDKDWKFTFLNSQAERMLQRCRHGLLGKTLWQEFPETVDTRIERECRQAVQAQRTSHLEAFYLPLKTWFDFHIYPTAEGLAVYFQDVTQRRAEQAQLRLLQTAVSRLNDMVVIMEAQPFDAAGRRIVFVNDAFERQTGYSRQEVVGNTPSILWGANTHRPEVDRILVAMNQSQPVRAELLIYTKAGQERWFEADIAPISNEFGEFTHWVAVERDITERRQQQQEILSLNTGLEERVLLRTFELEMANRELESFAYSISHDLRSPLNTIHAFSQLVVKNEGDRVSGKGQHYLERIGVNVKHMGDLIEGLLTLAQVSRKQINPEPVDLSSIARRIANDHREREPGRQTQWHIQDGLYTLGDAPLLLLLLQNLLGNAWKFTSREPLAHIQFGSEPDADGNTVFHVRDNGAGFDMAFAPKLFGTFERLHSPEEFSEAGIGIGLATVKRVVDRHAGRVWAQSLPNQGAGFFFTLSRRRVPLR